MVVNQILTRTFEEDLNGLLFAFTVANLGAPHPGQAVALRDS